ncbi:uncharacterized protein SOCE836_065170 [Sorangium cellulosum]|uniref:Uncharacterized protein n=1 Tax=Sorangium cellulosum TaxID=56 RepID=A0A4P2QVF9_SORCE|nr:PEGA domain-containing protein [Sorangium cellulosum]AUX34345.1 uncharacterized protein SOCE836_065170 [Sorangium cellulosum]
MKIHRPIAALLLAASLLASAAASAAPPTPPQEDALSATARDLFAKGAEAWNQRRYDECRASLLAAWSIKPYRQIAGNLGACEIKLGLYRDAAEHLSVLTRAAPDGKPAELSPEHRRLFDEALSKVAAVQIEVEPGATVLIDGKAVGQAPLSAPVYLEPGEHALEARTGTGAVTQISVRFEAGTQRKLLLHPQLPPAAEAPAAAAAAPPPPRPRRRRRRRRRTRGCATAW